MRGQSDNQSGRNGIADGKNRTTGKSMRSTPILLATSLLAACATSNGIVDTGGGTYYIAAASTAGRPTAAAFVYAEARQFCASRGSQMLLAKSSVQEGEAKPFPVKASGGLEEQNTNAVGVSNLSFKCEKAVSLSTSR